MAKPRPFIIQYPGRRDGRATTLHRALLAATKRLLARECTVAQVFDYRNKLVASVVYAGGRIYINPAHGKRLPTKELFA